MSDNLLSATLTDKQWAIVLASLKLADREFEPLGELTAAMREEIASIEKAILAGVKNGQL